MTSQASIAAFVGLIAIAALAFCLAWSLRSSVIRDLKAWLSEAQKNARSWQERHDKQQADREKDTSQLGAVIDTLKAREARLTQEYNERINAAEKWVPKRGKGGLFQPKAKS